MKKIFALASALLLLSPIAIGYGQQLSGSSAAGTADLRAADEAWQDGNYTAALGAYLRLLRGQGGDQLVESIATRTGELYQTEEITADGRAPRLSPDG